MSAGSGRTLYAVDWPPPKAGPKAGGVNQDLPVNQQRALLQPLPPTSPGRATGHGPQPQSSLRDPGGPCRAGLDGVSVAGPAPVAAQVAPAQAPQRQPGGAGRSEKLQAKVDAVVVGHPPRPLRLMLEDEVRFGRTSDPVRCWAPSGCRPEGPTHRARGIPPRLRRRVSPHDRELISLILPHTDTSAMSLYLAEVSRRHPAGHILMFQETGRGGLAPKRWRGRRTTSRWTGYRLTVRNAIRRAWSGGKSAASPANHDNHSIDAVEGAHERSLCRPNPIPHRF